MTDVRLDLGWVCRAVGGTLRAGDPAAAVRAVATDSRAVKPGDLFVALRGPRFDAHTFLPEVWSRGAIAAVVEPGRAESQGGAAIEVADTLQALQDLARAIRRASGARVVAITGSAGKTTTKDAIDACLATRFRVVKNQGNLNNHVGLPISLIELRTGPDVAVMELGMNHAGEIRALVAIAEPEVRVWTNVGDAHLGFFRSADEIADAKAEILENADVRTVLVANADDARITARIRTFPGRVITFGTSRGAAVQALEVAARGVDGTSARVRTPAGERAIDVPLPGRGNLFNALAATAVALEFGISLDEVAAALAALRPADRRGVVRRLRDGVVLLDDSYNSSPSALEQSLAVLASEPKAARRVAALGEMLELGSHAVPLHEASGRAAAAAGVDRLFVVGGDPARALARAGVSAGMAEDAVTWFETSAAAAPAVAAALAPGDLVLVKGSRGTRMDVVADRVVAELG